MLLNVVRLLFDWSCIGFQHIIGGLIINDSAVSDKILWRYVAASGVI